MMISFATIDPSAYNPYLLAGDAFCVLLFIAFIFSLLVFRQALQMTHVLPTPLSPWVRIVVIAYIIFTLGASIISLGLLI